MSNKGIYLQEYQSFRIGSDGNLQGVGLFISVEPRTGHLVSYIQRYLASLLMAGDLLNFDMACTMDIIALMKKNPHNLIILGSFPRILSFYFLIFISMNG